MIRDEMSSNLVKRENTKVAVHHNLQEIFFQNTMLLRGIIERQLQASSSQVQVIKNHLVLQDAKDLTSLHLNKKKVDLLGVKKIQIPSLEASNISINRKP